MMTDSTAAGRVQAALDLAARLAAAYADLPEVTAVALAGSLGAGWPDGGSDIDLYVYSAAPASLDARAAVARAGGDEVELGNQFWEPGDEWRDRASAIGVDVMFRQPAWIEEQLDRVLLRHEASIGYSTCFWHNVLHSRALFDRDGWYDALQRRAGQPYPEPLRRAVVAKNHPILRGARSSYLRQLERAAARGDLVSLNHRAAALLASYFDILFALNRLPHPGEKRLLAIVEARCPARPPDVSSQVAALLRAASDGGAEIAPRVHALVDGLDQLLAAHGLAPAPR